MLSTSKDALFPGDGTLAITKMSGHHHWWLAGSYNILEVDSMLVSWWTVFFVARW